MQIADEIHEHVKKMPIEMAREVLNFIEFLELKQNTSKQSPAVFLFPSVAWEYILGCVASCVDADRDAVKTAFPSDTWERVKQKCSVKVRIVVI